MCEWKECKLSDIANVQTGPFGSQLHMSDYKAVGTPIITVEHLGDNRIIHSNLPLVGDEDKERLKKYILKMGDVVFSRVGSVDRCAFVNEQENGWMFSGRLLRVRCNNDLVNSRFLSYYFSQESFKETIRMIAVGATMPSINTKILCGVDLIIPPLSEQRAIASVLSSLDDKIDLLHRQNKTLEAMAETLFRQWFVEEADEEWEAGKLGDYASVTTGKGLKRHEFIDKGMYPVLGANGEIGRTNNYLTEDRLILTGRVGTLGKVTISDDKVWISDNVLIVKPNKTIYFYPIYFNLKRTEFENLNVGSTQPLVTQTDLKNIDFSLPNGAILRSFESHCSKYYGKKSKNNTQIRTLEKLRDTLLPKLMSGEIRVKLEQQEAST